MRIWSLHPKYLDAKGLVAVWRETLLAKKVLEGNTKGYKNHSQLIRFKSCAPNELLLINNYLFHVQQEAKSRGYNFDFSKLDQSIDYKNTSDVPHILVTDGQINFEFEHIKNKTKIRCPEWYKKIKDVSKVELNNIFIETKGPVESWEKI